MQHLTAPPFLYAGAYGFGGRGIARDSAGTCMASGSDSALGPFSPHDPLLILHLVLQRPGIFLREIQDELLSTFEREVSESAICRLLHKNGFTCQRLQVTALQQDEFLRQQFVSEVSVYSPEMLVFIDETGTDRRSLVRKDGYSMRGKPLRNPTLFVRGERVSAIACISMVVLLDVKIITGTSDGDVL